MKTKRSSCHPSEYSGEILMIKHVGLFVEDFGHETVLKAILQRYAREYRLDISVQSRSIRGGHGKMLHELRQYLRDVQRIPNQTTTLSIVI
jgi:hypothetical protein